MDDRHRPPGHPGRYAVNDVSPNIAPSLQLRVRKSFLIVGVVSAVGFAAFGTWSVFAAALNLDGSFPHPLPMAVFFGMFWGGWFVLSLFLIAASCRERLTITSESIMHEGVFRNRTTSVSGITMVKWRAWPMGGSVVIRYPNSRITIHFANFGARERDELISRLRELIPEGCQDDWTVFSSSQHPTPIHPKKSRLSAILCMGLLFITAAVFVYCWHIRFGFQFLFVGVACGLAGLWYLSRILHSSPT